MSESKKIFNTILFILLFIIISLGMHLYVFARLATYEYIRFNIITVILLTCSFMIATILQNRFDNIVTRIIYYIAALWIGIGFMLFSTTLAMHILQIVFGIKNFIAAPIILLVTLIVTIYGLINAKIIHIKNVSIKSNKKSKDLKNEVKNHIKNSIKIVQLSDIHIGAINGKRFLEKVIEKVNKINPDIVFITGDLVDGSEGLEPETFAPIKSLKAKTFFITGNHETYEGIDVVEKNIKNTGMIFLRNQAYEYKGLEIIGVDYTTDTKYLEKILPKLKLDNKKFKILLYHTPTEVETANKYGIDLQLSGHTHNGQIMPFNLLARIFYKYIKGLYKYENTQIFVSQGTGTWGPPLRIFTNNEIVIISIE